MNELRLVPATAADVDLLFAWANDATTRKNAFHTEPIPYETHVRWFEAKLKDKNCMLYICKKGSESIGQIRLDREGDTAIISYSIAKEHRGNGYGSELLRLIEAAVHAEPALQNIAALVGYVKAENRASQKCFEKNGFTRQNGEDCVAFRKVLR